MSRQLWHYTCHHGRHGIGELGVLVPACQLTDEPMPWTGRLVWLTDLKVPMREALGLTQLLAKCDRTAHRYRVLDDTDASRWVQVAHFLPLEERIELEGAPGARPAHWYVSLEPVPVQLDEVQP